MGSRDHPRKRSKQDPRKGDASIRSAVTAASAKLELVLDLAPADVHRAYGLAERRGPNRLPDPTPSRAAWQLSVLLALDAIARTRACEWRQDADDQWRFHPPAADYDVELLPYAGALGIPLLVACSEDAFAVAGNLLAAKESPPLNQMRMKSAEGLSRFPLYEHRLWQQAAKLGTVSPRVPYAFAYYALEWFWDPEPDDQRHVNTLTLCLACGRPFRRRRKTPGLPRCGDCQDKPKALDFPQPRGVMPADDGKWWLACDGCDGYFRARRDAKWCPDCQLRKRTPAKRPSPKR